MARSKVWDGETSVEGSVAWLSEAEPPTQLLTHLRARGLALTRLGERESISPARLAFIAQGAAGTGRANLEGRRIALLHPDPGYADRQAQNLREKGGDVIVLALNPSLLDSVETFDPDVILVEPADFYASCWEMVRAIWAHPRLRWSPILLATPEPLGLGLGSGPNIALICGTIHALNTNTDAIAQRVRRRATFEIGLQELGPARTLRALTEPSMGLRARFETARCTVEVDIAEGIVVGARGGTSRVIDDAFLGAHALAQLLTEAHGRVQVHPVQSPAVTNVMAPLDAALHSARTSLAPPPARLASPAGVAPASAASPSADTPRPAALPLPALPMVTTKRARPPFAGLGFSAMAAASSQNAPVLTSDSSLASADTQLMPLEPERAPEASSPSDPGVPSPFHADEDIDASAFVRALPSIGLAARSRRVKMATGVALAGIVTLWAWPRGEDTQIRVASASVETSVSAAKPTEAAPGSALAAAPAGTEAAESDQEEDLDDGADDERVDSARRASKLVHEGHALRKKGMLDAARVRYLEALRQHHGYPRAYAGLTQVALAKRQGSEAVRFGKKLVKARPADSRYRLLLGDAYKLSGNLGAAKREWTIAARHGSKAARSRLQK